jgi:hypothetical protein
MVLPSAPALVRDLQISARKGAAGTIISTVALAKEMAEGHDPTVPADGFAPRIRPTQPSR